MTLTQVAQTNATGSLRVPVNTPAVYNGTPLQNGGHLTPIGIPTMQQIEIFQALLNEVSIRLAQLQESQEFQTQ